ncbi:MAG: N-acetyltransferase [Oscillospiraceae bacterium]|nr:N-acetyltransferase [Oscillospiraceae bacterium]
MLRIATEADVPAILAIYAPYVRNTTITFEYDVPSEAEFLDRFRRITREFPWLVWEENGEILGYAYATRPFERAAYRWCAEPSIYLVSAAQGRGIGRKLYLALEELLKLQGCQVLLALITGENQGSLRFHEKLGYSLAGELKDCGFKFNRWLSVFWMEKRIEIVHNPMVFPTDWGVLGQDAQKICDILYNLSLS